MTEQASPACDSERECVSVKGSVFSKEYLHGHGDLLAEVTDCEPTPGNLFLGFCSTTTMVPRGYSAREDMEAWATTQGHLYL